MPTWPVRTVLDTNVMVRGISHASSPSGRVLALCDRRMTVPLISGVVLAEYRMVLGDPKIVARYPEITNMKVETVLARLQYVGDIFRETRVRFTFPRDPKDAKFIELAIAGGATAIVTCDQDLLELPAGRDDAAKRFRQRLPTTQIMRPEDFVRWFEGAWPALN